MTATSPVTSLDGQVALVTGSSRGIGAVIARRMAQAGAKVALNYNASVDAAMEVKDSISNAGGDAMLTAGDVSDEFQSEQIIKAVVAEFGRVDILVNNAGIHRDRLLMRMTPADFDEVLQVNLRGAFLCTKFVMPHPDPAALRPGDQRVIGCGADRKPRAGQLRGRQGGSDRLHQGRGSRGRIPQRDRQRRCTRIHRHRNGGRAHPGPAQPDSGANSHGPLPGLRKMWPIRSSSSGSKGAGYLTGQVLTVDGGLIA